MKNVKTKSYQLLIAWADSCDFADKVDDEVWLFCSKGIIDPCQVVLWWLTYDWIASAVWERGGYGRL